MFERLNEDKWDDEYTVKSLKEFLNSPHIDDDFPVRLGISEWNFSKSCNFYARQITSFGKPFVCLESMEINNDYNEIYDKWTDKKIENNKLKKENEQLKSELSRYKEVNRLDLWKSSYSSEDALITELQDKCDKKQEHIVLLENKIHRMRENIKRLEALYHYKGCIGSGDVKKEYYRREKLLKAENDQLKKENEQLKSVVKEVIELLSNEVDLFSDKATEHDINAYIELKELDNKDAYYMATATKKSIKLLKGVADD